MVALLIIEDEPHDQGDHRVSAGPGDELVLGERVLLGAGVALHGLQEPLDRAAFGPVVYRSCNRKAVRAFNNEIGVQPICFRHAASPVEGLIDDDAASSKTPPPDG